MSLFLPMLAAATSLLVSDPHFDLQYGVENRGQVDPYGRPGVVGEDIDVQSQWSQGATGSRDVIVAVLDTGIDWDHPDLKPNLYSNPGEIAGNGMDDDANGFIDDVHGWNFVANSPDTRDDNGHGTHCAGTIGAVGDNGIGIAGVNWKVSLLPVKMLGAKQDGSLASMVAAIDYARLMKARVISASWSRRSETPLLRQAVERARDAGILFVMSAGNEAENIDLYPVFPAAYGFDNVITVANTDHLGRLAGDSSWGRHRVDIAAPGSDIYSTWPGGKYAYQSGTSMATPYVSGAAALLWSLHPEWTAVELRRRLIESADPLPALAHRVGRGGRLNVNQAHLGIKTPFEDVAKLEWIARPHALESPHPIPLPTLEDYTVRVEGARFLRLHFKRIDLAPPDAASDEGPERLIVSDARGDPFERITRSKDDYLTDYVVGDTAVIRLVSGRSPHVAGWGFELDRVEFVR